MRSLVYTAESYEEGMTALDFLKKHGFSRRIVTKLKQSGGLTRGGEILRSVDRIHAGDVISVEMEDSGTIVPNKALSAEIAYEDDDIVVFDKPPAMPVHPSNKHYSDTLGNLFAALYPECAFRPINRLDRDTSGLCVCAKNRLAAARLSKNVRKVYFAAVDGTLDSGRIDTPIGRTDDSIIKRCVTPQGKPAVTEYAAALCENGRTLLRVNLLTGRTHQIRVHFASIGYPLCGDDMYGGDCSLLTRQALHCGEVSFTQPVTGERITVKSDIPADIMRLFTAPR